MSNISISSLTNNISSNLSITSLINTNEPIKNTLLDNTFKTRNINSHSKNVLNDIINSNNQVIRCKEQVYNKIYDICLNQINTQCKLSSLTIFEVPKSYMDSNYNWIECTKYISTKLKDLNYDIEVKDNYIKIEWSKFSKSFI